MQSDFKLISCEVSLATARRRLCGVSRDSARVEGSPDEDEGRRVQLVRVQLYQDPLDAPNLAAMAAGVTDRLFDVADLVALLVESESKKAA